MADAVDVGPFQTLSAVGWAASDGLVVVAHLDSNYAAGPDTTDLFSEILASGSDASAVTTADTMRWFSGLTELYSATVNLNIEHPIHAGFWFIVANYTDLAGNLSQSVLPDRFEIEKSGGSIVLDTALIDPPYDLTEDHTPPDEYDYLFEHQTENPL